MTLTSIIRVSGLAVLLTLMTACGGGGGGGSSSSSSSTGASSSSSDSSSSSGGVSTTANSVAITVDRTLSNVDIPYVSVTICAPGSATNCTTVSHVLVDTGSTGLRVLASALTGSFISSLTAQTVSGYPLAECMQFASGYTWGTVRAADLYMAGEKASALPVQIIGDSSYATVPSTCSSTGSSMGTTGMLYANGILGVSQSMQDCGSGCTVSSAASIYFKCTSPSTCTRTTLPLANQIPNPVSKFSTDNNGVVVQLPAIPANGLATASGLLIFGVGTQSNNALGSATVLGTDAYGNLQQTSYNGTSFTYSFFDSGSNGYFFPSSLTSCTSGNADGWYCPSSTTTLSATVTGRTTSSLSSQSVTVSFNIANASSLFSNSYAAYSNLGATTSGMFDFGLPFFFGRSVFVGFDGQSTSAGNGPFVAF